MDDARRRDESDDESGDESDASDDDASDDDDDERRRRRRPQRSSRPLGRVLSAQIHDRRHRRGPRRASDGAESLPGRGSSDVRPENLHRGESDSDYENGDESVSVDSGMFHEGESSEDEVDDEVPAGPFVTSLGRGTPIVGGCYDRTTIVRNVACWGEIGMNFIIKSRIVCARFRAIDDWRPSTCRARNGKSRSRWIARILRGLYVLRSKVFCLWRGCHAT